MSIVERNVLLVPESVADSLTSARPLWLWSAVAATHAFVNEFSVLGDSGIEPYGGTMSAPTADAPSLRSLSYRGRGADSVISLLAPASPCRTTRSTVSTAQRALSRITGL